ncbi:MAG TPA: DUF2461 domain-containing protein [Puia sp.]|jgi:uncharacterized protein (TIGR02453 family)
MASIIIKKESLDFLRMLSKNNNREWFNKRKDKYLEARNNIIGFADALLTEMNKHDRIETQSGKDALFRIYKDVRFSKDKTPYNTHWSGAFKRATKKLRGGYYFNIKPGSSLLAGGFWGPEPQDMKRIREDIGANYEDWRKLLAARPLSNTFGKMTGDQLGTAPRGYYKDHPAIDLLRYKQFILRYEFSDKEVCSPGFLNKMNEVYKKMRPFLNYLSEVLTTDANGVSFIE